MFITGIEKAVEFYSDAIKLYPKECTEELAICHANRAACNIKIVSYLVLILIIVLFSCMLNATGTP